MWWGLLILPYVVGWLMALWGPGNPRWFSLPGMAIGLWYLAMAGIILTRQGQGSWALVVVIATIGIVAIAGCIYRLKNSLRSSKEQSQ